MAGKKYYIAFFLLFIQCSIAATLIAQINVVVPAVQFSHRAGFYEQEFTLTLNVPDQDYTLVYTIDGSNPQKSLTAINGGKSTTITINPQNANGRPRTPCFLVRASLKEAGGTVLLPVSRTYIFLSEVVNQKNPGGGWPTSNVNGQIIDLEMDDKVTKHFSYQAKMKEAFTAIPSISIITDLSSLFDPTKGLYVNADRHGENWERFCSVEQINLDHQNEFNCNAGLRIRGGWSRHDNFPKHAFRLFFKSEYGAAQLEFPLFGNEGVKEFDKVDLRTAQNYAWSNGQDHNTFVREVFSRDSQRDMGQPYTRSRYYHLYLNGMYWGLYQTQERSEARFAADYFGRSKEDYDVVKVDTENYIYQNEATDGNMEAWERIWNYCKSGFTSNALYFNLEGKDQYGKPVPGKEKLVDIDNLIDYMLTIFYTGNFDAPTTAFRANSAPNNYYAIFKRDDKTKGFQFFNHDAEHSLMIDELSPGTGLYQNRVVIPNMSVSGVTTFHPQWLHFKLTENAEYLQHFADRVYLHFFNDGAFTPKKAEERFMKRAREIDVAIIAESARWGDTFSNVARTRDNDWLPEIEKMQYYFFPNRTDIVLGQLIDAGLYNYFVPPKFTVDNTTLFSNQLTFYDYANIIITSINTSGQIYITTDGTDPREPGGNVNPNAQAINSGFKLDISETIWIKARVKSGDEWSALRVVHLIKSLEDFQNLKVTELHYHPADSILGTDTISGKSFEFIEIKNAGNHAIDLSGLKFTNGIDFRFKSKTMLAPYKFFVIAASSKWFFEQYGVAPSDTYSGSFDNSGEVVSIFSSDNREVIQFVYSNQNPWPTEPDGEGFSLTSAKVYPISHPNDVSYWKASTFLHGSPFYDDLGWKLAAEDEADATNQVQVFPNPTAQLLFFKCSTESRVEVELYTMAGQKIHHENLFQNSIIDLKQLNLKPGLILVKLLVDGHSEVKKILYRQ